MAEFVTGPVAVQTPSTSANLGPGYDSFGLSLALYDRVEATALGSGVEVEAVGECAASVPRDESHLIVRTMRSTFALLRVSQPGLRLRCSNAIPHGRGLGSSAAAIVAGIRLAEALTNGARLSHEQILTLATEIEGHPDNVAACLLGGFTIAWGAERRSRAARFDVHPDLRPAVFIPPKGFSTDAARALLPREVPHADASDNAARSGLLAAALTQAPEYLLAATEDYLHQSYRGAAMPDSSALVGRLRSAGVAAVVSGAGPTVLALGTAQSPVDVDAWLPIGWSGLALPVDPAGAHLI